jgi:predicted permease
MMRWINNLRFRVRALFGWRQMRNELDEEMSFHIERETEKHIAQGMSPEDARREALIAFGGVQYQKSRVQDAWGVSLLQDLRFDVRHTLRGFRRNPVFTLVAVLTLAMGIGGTSAIFSVVNGVLLKPLPFRDPGELVSVHHVMSNVSSEPVPLGPAFYFTFRDHSRTLQDIGLWRQEAATVTGLAEPERVDVLQVTEGLFPLLGVTPTLGRGFTVEEVSPGSTIPIILSHGYWLQRFGGDRQILGSTLRVEGMELEIIGVMPAGFRIHDVDAQLYAPMVLNRDRIGVGNWSFPGIARLRPGVSVEEANRDLDRLTVVASEAFGGIPLETLRARDFTSIVRPLRDDLVGEASTVLWVVFGTVWLVLLIACTNVANLFLVRAEGRQRDVALRTAMGASRGRLTRQFLSESLLVGLLGGGAGLLLAAGGIGLFLRLAPSNLPRLEEIALDGTILAFTLGISVLTGLLFGTIPLLRYGRGSLAEPLKEGGRGSSAGRTRFRLRSVFAVTQVAMALVLLVASGLMVRSFQALRAVPPGFQEPEEVLTLRLAVPSSEVADVDEATMALQAVMDRMAMVPGVSSVGAAASVAMEAWESWDDWEAEGHPVPEGEAQPMRRLNWIVPGYFETIRNPVLVGRVIEWADIYDRRNVIVVTENLAREHWGEPEQALGRRLRTGEWAPWREIVGVVGNVHSSGVAAEAPKMVYLPFITANHWGAESFSVRELRYAIRTSMPSPESLLPEIRALVDGVNPNLALADVRTLDDILGDSIARTSFTLVMLGLAAGVALLLGLVGVYGVISYIDSQRTRGMGVRLALGATKSQVGGMVLRHGAVLGVVGVIVGMGAAAGLTRLMTALLFGVSPGDPLTYGGLASALVAVVLLASYLPARRAAKVDPTEALRWE